MKVIILSGKSGSGKDMTAYFMKEHLEALNKKVIIIHYADAVKWILKDFFGWDGQKDEHGRHLLQYIGTDVVRTNFPNYWVDIVAKLLAALQTVDNFDVAIIPDARFENEIEVTMRYLPDACCVRIERQNADGTPWINPQLTEEQQKHPSETSLDHYAFDYIIHNDEGLELLKESAYTLLQDLGVIE